MDTLAGKFIVLDGPDGCGKSTQAKLLREWIENQGIDVTAYRDPGTTVVGEKIRDILLDTAHTSMGDNTEVLLYMAARAQLWKEHIGPDLAQGKCVVMDRWISSTCAYQGCGGGFGIEKVIKLGTDCLERVWPDLTIVLDVDLDTSASRMQRDLDRMEQKGDEYHQKVRDGYRTLADQHPEYVSILDSNDSIEDIHLKILELIKVRWSK